MKKFLKCEIFIEYCAYDETGEWRRLHNGELHGLYGKPDIIRIV